jgi:predicted transposase/invertase (TIGR01784 family)
MKCQLPINTVLICCSEVSRLVIHKNKKNRVLVVSKLIHQPHDKLFKKSMADIRVARDFFETHLPRELTKKMDFKTLKLQKNSFIDQTFKATEADILYTVNIDGELAYLYLLCEHQSKIDANIAFRLLVYTVRIMEMHRSQYPEGPLPVVYPLVVYTGKEDWNAPRDIFQMFGANAQLAKQIFLQS